MKPPVSLHSADSHAKRFQILKAHVKGAVTAHYQQVLLVFLAFLAMVLVSCFYVSQIVQRQMFAIGEEMMNAMESAVSANLKESELSFANIVHTVDGMLDENQTNDDVLRYLTEMTEYFISPQSPMPDFMKLYGYLRGQFLDGSGWIPPPEYSPPSRPWYVGADRNNGRIFFSEPYIDADSGGTCISFSQKIFARNGGGIGILSVDLNLTRISDYVRQQKLANHGYGFLLSDTMNFTTHRDEKLVGKNLEETSSGYAALASMIREGKNISAIRFTDVDGTDSIAFLRTIFNGWHIGVVTPRASYYHQVHVLAFVISVLGFALMSMLSYLLIRTRTEKLRSDEENKSKSEFLSRMSHEMRTPMNAIIGMSNIAKTSDDMERVQYCIEKIGEASNHLLGVINDILDMSKIEAGKFELSKTDFLFSKLIDQVNSVVQFKIEEKLQSFEIRVNKAVPTAIVADQQRLAQVITNLIGNAMKFTPKGGHIGLNIHPLERMSNQCMLQVEVEDTGIGISKEQQAKLFRSFEQGDGSISRKFGGTGLGLVICKNIVEMMGGTIWVESEPGKGSKFIFTIWAEIGQANAEEPKPDTAEPDTAMPVFEGKRILLAEDVEINREILIALLADTKVSIDYAKDGREACDMFVAANGAYDMIFMDIHMPEVDGLEATRRIRAMDMSRAKSIPIVAMTANVFREDIEKCLAAGMNGHVGKPLNLEEVLAQMKTYLR